MLEETEDREEIIERVAALDIGKAEVVVCVRVPSPTQPGRRAQEIATFSTMTRSLLRLADRLRELGVTRVVMEATSDYWKPAFYLLEAQQLDPWLVNAKDVKHLPGRPKTDKLDAVWLCKVAERQMLRPSFVPPVEIRRLRDLTRYRADLVAVRTAEKNRVEKLLEDAQIKLSVVASDIFGVSGREMLAALLAGERDPKALAQLARTRMRAKIPLLEEAFVGHFTDHHAFLLRTMLARIDETSADIAAVETRIDELITPFAQAVEKLDQIPGVGTTAAHVILAEIGTDMTRWPSEKHFTSWLTLAPNNKISGGRLLSSQTPPSANRAAAIFRMAAMSLGRTETALGAFYRRLAFRVGKAKAITATARKLAVLVYRTLKGEMVYCDAGATAYDAQQQQRVIRRLRQRAATLGFDLLNRETGEVLEAAVS